VLAVVLLGKLLAVTGGLTGELGGMLDGKRGNAGVGEREMVGTEVVALLGLASGEMARSRRLAICWARA